MVVGLRALIKFLLTFVACSQVLTPAEDEFQAKIKSILNSHLV